MIPTFLDGTSLILVQLCPHGVPVLDGFAHLSRRSTLHQRLQEMAYLIVFHFLYSCSSDAVDLLDRLLTLDPKRRITAFESLDHDYFWSSPPPADPKTYVPRIYTIAIMNLPL